MVSKSKYKAMQKIWGRKVAAVLRRIAEGWTTERIANRFNMTRTSVATFKANFTRDRYYPYAYPKTPYFNDKE